MISVRAKLLPRAGVGRQFAKRDPAQRVRPMKHQSAIPIEGHVSAGFEAVRDAFGENEERVAMTRELNDFRIERRLDTGNTNDFVLLLANGRDNSRLTLSWAAASRKQRRLARRLPQLQPQRFLASVLQHAPSLQPFAPWTNMWTTNVVDGVGTVTNETGGLGGFFRLREL